MLVVLLYSSGVFWSMIPRGGEERKEENKGNEGIKLKPDNIVLWLLSEFYMYNDKYMLFIYFD